MHDLSVIIFTLHLYRWKFQKHLNSHSLPTNHRRNSWRIFTRLWRTRSLAYLKVPQERWAISVVLCVEISFINVPTGCLWKKGWVCLLYLFPLSFHPASTCCQSESNNTALSLSCIASCLLKTGSFVTVTSTVLGKFLTIWKELDGISTCSAASHLCFKATSIRNHEISSEPRGVIWHGFVALRVGIAKWLQWTYPNWCKFFHSGLMGTSSDGS